MGSDQTSEREHALVPGGLSAPVAGELPAIAVLSALKAVPEEEVWLQGHRSPATRRAYRMDVVSFMAFFRIQGTDELRAIDRAAVLAWLRQLEGLGVRPATIRRKLSALSSLFAHLVHHHVLVVNPCREIARPRTNRRRGTTAAFSPHQARQILDAPALDTVVGLRDRALLSVGFQTGARRASIAGLVVGDLFQDGGHDVLRFRWKGGHEHVVALHPETADRIRQYVVGAGIEDDADGPLFRPVLGRTGDLRRRHLDPKVVDEILKRHCRRLGVNGRFSAHSMRATFITTALANGASLEDVQEAAGHADPSTTKLYDRRRFNPERSAARFAGY